MTLRVDGCHEPMLRKPQTSRLLRAVLLPDTHSGGFGHKETAQFAVLSQHCMHQRT